tara:strand:- start:628 stop:858 length:231 start_codon:yes stop_codon:yes gene_type:complete
MKRFVAVYRTHQKSLFRKLITCGWTCNQNARKNDVYYSISAIPAVLPGVEILYIASKSKNPCGFASYSAAVFKIVD